MEQQIAEIVKNIISCLCLIFAIYLACEFIKDVVECHYKATKKIFVGNIVKFENYGKEEDVNVKWEIEGEIINEQIMPSLNHIFILKDIDKDDNNEDILWEFLYRYERDSFEIKQKPNQKNISSLNVNIMPCVNWKLTTKIIFDAKIIPFKK